MSKADFLNRRRWAIDQQKKARAKHMENDKTERGAREIERLNQLGQLATALADMPHMATTLQAVTSEIAAIEKHYCA